MDKANETQKPKRREFFKVDNPEAELKGMFEEVEKMSIQEIKRRLPGELIRNIYTSLLLLEKELSIKQGKRREKAAEYLIKLSMNPTFWKNLKRLEEMAAELPKKEEKEPVKWIGEKDSKGEKNKQVS